MSRLVCITPETAHGLLEVLASLTGAAIGVSNVIPSLKETIDPLCSRAERIADEIRPLLAQAIARSMESEGRQ